MGKKKLYVNVVCILCLAVVVYHGLGIEYRIGIIRDEYGITGNDGLLTVWDKAAVFFLPVFLAVLNLAVLFGKQLKKVWVSFVTVLSVCMVLAGAAGIIRINRNLDGFVSVNHVWHDEGNGELQG